MNSLFGNRYKKLISLDDLFAIDQSLGSEALLLRVKGATLLCTFSLEDMRL